jgi:putative Mg2+ transporter-C (MgtC) family protein
VTISDMEMLFRLILACVLGGLIGWERERVLRPAGLRTHTIVCLASTLIMLISLYGFPDTGGQPRMVDRIAAQVVSGIGFLGAGAIIHDGFSVKGVTTAATLWAAAAIGLGVGAGYYAGSVATTGIVLFILMGSLEKYLFGRRSELLLVIDSVPGQVGRVAGLLGSYGITIRDLLLHELVDNKSSAELSLRVPQKVNIDDVVSELSCLEGVCSVELRISRSVMQQPAIKEKMSKNLGI